MGRSTLRATSTSTTSCWTKRWRWGGRIRSSRLRRWWMCTTSGSCAYILGNPHSHKPETTEEWVAMLRGYVVSGMGNFSYWIEKLQEHYLRKTGMRFYPGTLNVRLDAPYSLPKQVIRLEASEYGGRVSVSMVPCFIRI